MHVFVFIVTELTLLTLKLKLEFYIFIMENSMKVFSEKKVKFNEFINIFREYRMVGE